MDLVILGHLVKEKIIFSDGREMGPVLGSPAAYGAVAAAKLGLKAGIVTKIGKDMPEGLLEVFKEAGVDTEGLRIGDNTTTNFLIYEKSGEKRLEFLKKADDITFKDIPEKYLNCPVFLICPLDYEIPFELMQKLSFLKKEMAVDLGGYGGASSKRDHFTKEEKLSYLKRIIPFFKIVKAGREDCQHLFDGPSLTAEKILTKFLGFGAEVSIVTLASEGVMLTSYKEGFKIPAFPSKAIDCTGAGDVWYSAFLCEYISEIKNAKHRTKTLEQVIKKSALFASATASLMIEKTGGVFASRMPTAEQVRKRLEKIVPMGV